jgi:hypothetical protein
VKTLAIILSFLTLFLSSQNCCLEAEDSCEDVKTTRDCSEESESHLPCLPFFSCGACIGFTTSQFESNLTFFADSFVKVQLPCETQFIPDFSPPGLMKPPSIWVK